MVKDKLFYGTKKPPPVLIQPMKVLLFNVLSNNEKKDLQDKAGEIEKAGGGWLEPAREFVTTCNQAGFVAWQGNLVPKRDFLKILGSNFKILDRTLSLAIEKPFSFVSGKGLKAIWLPPVDSNHN